MVDPRLSRLAEKRAIYARTNANMLINDPSGYMVTNGPINWADLDPSQNSWWYGRDDGGGAYAIGPNGPWVNGSSLLPAVTRCLTIIAGTTVRTLWRYSDRDGNFLPRPLWVDDPMGIGKLPGVLQPLLPAGLRLDGQKFFETWLSHAVLWGLGAFVYVENSNGEPTAGTLRILNPYLIGISDDGHYVIDPNGETPIKTDHEGRFIAGGKIWRLAVLHGLAPNDFRTPEGVLTRHFDTFKLGAAVSKYVANTFAGMGVPSGLLKVSTPGFKKTDAEELKEQWMNAHGASKRSVAVLNSTVEFQPISITPVDAGAESAVHVTRAEIAHAFGLSAIWLDEGASGLTYQNNSDRRRDLVDISLSGWSEAMMAVLSSLMPIGMRVEVNWPTFTQPSIELLAQPLVQLVQTGILTAYEARQVLALERPMGPDPAFNDNSPATKEASNASMAQITAGTSVNEAGTEAGQEVQEGAGGN